jgi:hypothetical protein
MYNNFFDVNSYSQAELEIIEKLILFDRKAYLQKYIDVANSGMDPLKHFLTFGMYEERFPWPTSYVGSGAAKTKHLMSSELSLQDLLGFDETFYSRTYPDVPGDYFQHFISYGIHERRIPFDLYDNAQAEVIAWDVMEKLNISCGESLDRQLYFYIENGEELIATLRDSVNKSKVLPKTYRNNFWLLMAVGFAAQGFFGAASICYNYFYNYFIPMPQLSNWQHGVYIAGKVVKTVDYARKKKWTVKPLSAEKRVVVPDPEFLNRANSISQEDVYSLPEPYYCLLEDVVLIGGSSMILNGGHNLLYDYLDVGDKERKAEFKGPSVLHGINDSCTIKYIYSDYEVPEAFSLMHDHGHNYFHWLIEVLPRFLLARKNGLVPNVPLLCV